MAQAGNAERTLIPTGPYRIAGKAVNARAGDALARCRVTIADVKNEGKMQLVITDDDSLSFMRLRVSSRSAARSADLSALPITSMTSSRLRS